MKFIIGSVSERKIDVAKKLIEQFFEGENLVVLGHPSDSEVPDTPYDKQTFDGAKKRAQNSKIAIPDGDYHIGLESGLINRYDNIYEEAWAVVIDANGKEYYGYSSGLKVPLYLLERMDELKMEHCDVMTIVEKELGNLPNDTWGTYSGGVIAREKSLEESLRNALIQIIAPNDSLYKK